MMTQRQRDALRFISDFIRERGYSPTFGEMADGLGLMGKASVPPLIDALVERGLIRKRAHTTRGIKLVEVKPKGRRVGFGLRETDSPLNPALIALESCDRADEQRSA